MLKVDRLQRDDLRSFLVAHANVNCVFKINNEYDFIAETVFKNIRDVEEFKEKLEERFPLQGLKIFYVVEDLKREGFLADPLLLDAVPIG